VATLHGAFHEAIVDGVTGLLVPECNPDALATALVDVLESPSRACEMGKAGRKHVFSNFNARTQGRKLAELYQTVLKQR